jgi:manganese-dependent ADP-ribose/CDP-alcohol diphosphatase
MFIVLGNSISSFQVKMRHRIGLIADVQYADIDDVWNFMKTHKRKYRSTLTCLKNAVDWWLTIPDIDLVLDLGDAIDGFRNTDLTMGLHAIERVMEQWKRFENANPKAAVPHLIGNHELYKFTRHQLAGGVGPTGFHCSHPTRLRERIHCGNQFYYSFKLSSESRWRIVVLDPYEESVMRNGGGRVGFELTLENGGLDPSFTKKCQDNNPNDILKATNYFAGLQGEVSRWCPFNGGVGQIQLDWLDGVLARSEKNHEKVLIASHVILHPSATPGGNCHTLLWDYEKVLPLFETYSCVKLVVCGHAHHEAYYHCPKTGVHHISVPSPLEAPDNVVETTFGLLELSDEEDVVTLIGQGWVTSREMRIT